MILVDCLRHDYVNKNDSPFLNSLAEKGIKGDLMESFGFQQLPAIFAGLHPEGSESGHALYIYDPENSPFKDIEELKFKKTSENEPSKALFKEYLTTEIRKIERSRGHNASASYGYPAEIPYEMLPNFAFSEKVNIFEPDSLPAPTLFDILRQHNMQWLWIAYPTDDQRTHALLETFKKRIRPEHSFVYLHFAELDWAGHEHGPDSQERRKIQREIDAAVKEIYEILEGMFDEVNCLIFGDHGMVEIKKTIDIESQLKTSGLKVPEDLVYFLDSTQARFWFKNEHAKKVVEDILGRFLYSGRILNEDDLTRLHIGYDNNKFGEMFFAVNESVMIYPNFFQRTSASRGMHGYLPEVRDNLAAFIVTGCGQQKRPEDPIDMVDIFPMILDLMGLPVPETNMGKSLLNIAPARDTPDHAQIREKQERRFVSVIIPTYNRKEVLERTLRAYSDQTYPEDKFEVIVIDDGSTDGTEQVVKSLVGGSNYKLRYFKQDNKGPAAARNLGIKEAAGEIVLITGDDCIPDSKLIEEHVRYHDLKASENVGVLGYTGLHPEIEETPFLEYIYQGPQFSYHTLKNGCEVSFGNFYTSNISMSKQKLIDIGLFDEDFKYAAWEDVELGYRLYKTGFKVIYDQDAVTYHYHNSDLQSFIKRHILVGQSAIILYKKHPELKDWWLGMDSLANPIFREQFYESVIKYYSLVGMEKGLRNGVKNKDDNIILVDELEVRKLKYLSLLERNLKEKSEKIDEINYALKDRDARIKNQEAIIQEKQAILTSMLSSTSWKMTAPIRWIHSKIISLKSGNLMTPFRWIHSRVVSMKIWRMAVILSSKSPSEFWAIGKMYLKQNGIRGAFGQILRDFNKKISHSDLIIREDVDWQVYKTLSNKIAEIKKANLTNVLAKPLKFICIGEGELVAYAKSLQFPAVKNPQVSIIIPVYNNEKLTIECLISILKNTPDVSYEIIIIDDGSTEKMQEIVSHIGNIKYIKNEKNLGFLLSCNHAAEKASGEFILFLNNDAQVMDNWLSPLVETFLQFPKVGAVGPKVLYPNGRLQEAGAFLNKDISSRMIGLFDDPELQKYNYLREVDYCSGVCLIIQTKIFRELGGFDISYAPGYYEDSDLCFRLRSKGLRILYNPKSTVVHHLSATSNIIDGSYKQQCIIKNRQKFSEKWQKQIDELNNIRLIAFYLPQYHAIPENDRWWGKGFTEWTNVTKARPNFEGHYQPRLPSDLGYYDLRVEEVMEKQAELAKKYGIHGFCYYYYWFGGKRLLEMPLERILKSGKPNIPFCICWANENWTRKWDGLNDKILMAQQHSDEDDSAVIRDIMRYMKHPNYIRINGRPLLMIYRVNLFPNIKRTVSIWRDLCRREGIGEIYLSMVESFENANKTVQSENDFDASVEFPPHNMSASIKPPGILLNPDFVGEVHDYRKIVLKYSLMEKPGNVRFRTVMPSWDNTARRQNDPHIFAYSSPGAYQAWLESVMELTLEQNFGDERIVFINAWNEWAEGNYLEPDRRFGHGYLEATRNAVERMLLKR